MTKWVQRTVVFLVLASASLHTTAFGEEEYITRLREFVDGLRTYYSQTLNSSHEFMISSYYYNLGTDLQLASNVLTQSIAWSRSEAIKLASIQARLDLLIEGLTAGRVPGQTVFPAYRDAYFGQFEIREIKARLELVFLDIEKLKAVHSSFCSMDKQEYAQVLFQPEHYYASTVFSVITPPAPNFGGYVQFTFDSQGNLTDADAGPGSGPQQLPPGFTDEENLLVYGTGAAAASFASYLGAGSAAGPIGTAVVIVGYAILSGIKNEDRVRAIEEQVGLMEEADAIHDGTISEIQSKVPMLTKKYCEAVAAHPNIEGPINRLVAFAEGNEGREFVAELSELEAKLAESASFLNEWLQNNIGIDANVQLKREAEEILDEMAVQWDFEEQNAGQFWSERINTKFVVPTGPVISFRPTVEERAAALDALTWGDCRYALCYPLANEDVPSELDPSVSIVWKWHRERLAGLR